MKDNAKLKKGIIWTISILALVVIAAIVGWHYLKKDIQSPQSKVVPVVTKEVKKLVTEASDSLYKIKYSSFNFNLDSGYAIIENLQMQPDSLILKKLANERRAPNNVLNFSAGKIIIKNIGFDKIQGEQALHIGNMTVINSKVSISNKLRDYNDTSKGTSWLSNITNSLFKSKNFDAIVDAKIDNILMKNTSIIYINNNEAKRKSTALKNLDIIIKNVATDAMANKDSKNQQAAIVKIGSQRIVTEDKLYYVDFNNIKVIPAERKVYIGSFALTPTLSKAAFIKAVKAGKANYRYRLKSTGISMSNIDFEKLSKKQQFYIADVTMDYSWGEFYTNYNWPLRTPPNRRNKYPHELLQTLAFDVTIGKMQIKKGDIIFRIVTEKTDKEAVLTLNNLQSSITNITNNVAAKNRNQYTTIQSKFNVMNTGMMLSKYKLNLKDKRGSFTLSSTLGTMDGTAYNPLTEPLAMLQIKSLQINKLQLDMKADEYKAIGNIDFFYKNYKVNLLKERDTTMKNRTFVSLFSNAVLPNDNPKPNGKFRQGPINIIRDPKESFFGFQWRAMLDGLSSSMTGADQNKEKPKNKITRLGKLIFGPRKGQEHKSTGKDKKLLQNTKQNKD